MLVTRSSFSNGTLSIGKMSGIDVYGGLGPRLLDFKA